MNIAQGAVHAQHAHELPSAMCIVTGPSTLCCHAQTVPASMHATCTEAKSKKALPYPHPCHTYPLAKPMPLSCLLQHQAHTVLYPCPVLPCPFRTHTPVMFVHQPRPYPCHTQTPPMPIPLSHFLPCPYPCHTHTPAIHTPVTPQTPVTPIPLSHPYPCHTHTPAIHTPVTPQAPVTPIPLSHPYPCHTHTPVTPIPMSQFCHADIAGTLSAMPIPLSHPWPLHTPRSAMPHSPALKSMHVVTLGAVNLPTVYCTGC